MSIKIVPQALPVAWPPQADEGSRLVIVQSDLRRLKQVGPSGFQHPQADQERQIALLQSALTLGNPETGPKAWFTLLPEYSLPSGRFADCEAAVGERLLPNTVCIAGFDGMAKTDWLELIRQPETKNQSPLVELSDAKDFHWVNFAVIWAKDAKGTLYRYLQPKLRPAPDEEPPAGMLEGEHVFYFEAGARSFAVLICFDIMANLPNGTTVARELRDWLTSEAAAGRNRPLTLWVIQHNPRPDHDMMKNAVHELISAHERCTVAYINGAQWDKDSGQWKSGTSRFYLHKLLYPPTAKNTPLNSVPVVYRRVGTGDLQLTNVSLRIGRPVIHTLTYLPPGALPLNAGSRRQLIFPHTLYLLDTGVPHPTSSVAACQHEVTEVAETANPLLKNCHLTPHEAAREQLGRAYTEVKQQLADLKLDELHCILNTLFLAVGFVPNPDFWDESERRAVMRLIQALFSLVAGGFTLSLAPVTETERVTANCGQFTLSVVQGDDQKPPDAFYDLAYGMGYTGAGHHVLLVLEHSAGVGDIKPVPILPEGEIAPDPIEGYSSGEEKMGTSRLYWYSRQAMETLLLKAEDGPALKKAIQEVFTWQTACA